MRIPLAKEGTWHIAIATLVCATAAWAASLLWPPLASAFLVVWIWAISFFRDPQRRGEFSELELCSPADGTMTEVTRLDHEETIDGPAVRMGMFLSLFNVHVNRSPCAGRVRLITYRKGSFLDARHPECGVKNESNTLVIDPKPPMPGPVVVRQVAGLVARRIVCHVRSGDELRTGERFGMIKFGSRTELIIPLVEGTEILVEVGDKVKGGLTLMARQPASLPARSPKVGDAASPSMAASTAGRGT